MKKQTALACLAAALLTVMGVYGQQANDQFNRWDKNNDGKVTKEELDQQAPGRFERLDADHDNVVTLEELDGFLKRRNNSPAAPGKAPETVAGEKSEADSQRQRSQNAAPTHGDVKYGTHERQVMDVWLAKSEQPTPVLVSIHGGGFTHGDKSVEPALLDECLKSGISVVAITYRLSQDAIAPAPFLDGARAIQFIRHKARKWNIDPARIAATGGSAGAGISLWLGFHDDLADPDNDDPVLRQSSRLTCMAVSNGQTSYDPRFIRELFPNDDQVYRIGALRKLFDADLDHLDQLPEEKLALFEEVSPIHHLTNDDVPALLTYMVKDSDQESGIHNPRFGHTLKSRMDALGIHSEVVTHLDRDDPRYASVVTDFIKREFEKYPVSIPTAQPLPQ